MGEDAGKEGEGVEEEALLVDPAGEPQGMNVTFRELDREAKRKIYRDSRPWLGRGTPPTREELVEWLRSMDEGELAANQEAIMAAEAEEAARWAAEDAEEEGRKKAKGASGGKKGKGKGKKSERGSRAEERHVERMEEGRSK